MGLFGLGFWLSDQIAKLNALKDMTKDEAVKAEIDKMIAELKAKKAEISDEITE